MKKEFALLATLLLGGIVVFIILLLSRAAVPVWTQTSSDGSTEIAVEYTGNNNWRYKINGELPTPCYRKNVDIVENNNVYQITLNILPPSSDILCAQVITPFEETGSIQADRSATFTFYTQNDANDGEDVAKTFEKDGFTINTSFDTTIKKWKYNIEGFVPTACHSAVPEVVVRESFPEQVLITIHVVKNQNTEMCAEVLTQIKTGGNFNASPQAQIEVAVNRQQ